VLRDSEAAVLAQHLTSVTPYCR